MQCGRLQDDEGLYAALPAIHAELNQLSLAKFCLPAESIAAAPPPPSMPSQMPSVGSLDPHLSTVPTTSNTPGLGRRTVRRCRRRRIFPESRTSPEPSKHSRTSLATSRPGPRWCARPTVGRPSGEEQSRCAQHRTTPISATVGRRPTPTGRPSANLAGITQPAIALI